MRDNLSSWTMSKVYIACAAAGGTVLVGQFGLNLFGLGDGADADVDLDHDLEGGEGLNILSVRAMAGFLTFFGLVGWMGVTNQWRTHITIFAAFGSGISVMLLVAWLMQMFKRLTRGGNIDPTAAVGRTAQVYLRVPANKQGRGKITLSLQGRTVELAAITAGAELPTGSACRVIAQTTGDVFEVEALEASTE
jgi:hypothetical protein